MREQNVLQQVFRVLRNPFIEHGNRNGLVMADLKKAKHRSTSPKSSALCRTTSATTCSPKRPYGAAPTQPPAPREAHHAQGDRHVREPGQVQQGLQVPRVPVRPVRGRQRGHPLHPGAHLLSGPQDQRERHHTHRDQD